MKHDIQETRLNKACETLAIALSRVGFMRCMGCDTHKPTPSKRWSVVGYLPDDPRHSPVAYALCDACRDSEAMRNKAIMGIETMSRQAFENRMNKQ